MGRMGTAPNQAGMFNEPPKERNFPTTAVAIAAVAVVVLAVLFVAMGRHSGSAGNANYAPNLALSELQVSAADNMAGGTTVYVDGKVTNNGSATVTGMTAQATFASNGGAAPQVQTDQAKALRTKDPVDLEPMSSQPLAPGASEDFRLIYEGVKEQWDQQTPQVKVLAATTK